MRRRNLFNSSLRAARKKERNTRNMKALANGLRKRREKRSIECILDSGPVSEVT